MQVKIIGAGLAGCEAALWLADRGVQVELYEQKPAKYSPAHKSGLRGADLLQLAQGRAPRLRVGPFEN